MQLNLDRDGAQLFEQLVSGELLGELGAILTLRPRAAGIRLSDDAALYDWICDRSPLGELARSLRGAEAKPVRAILFDKSKGANWTLGWHQDRTIAVRDRIEAAGYINWTRKAGTAHVEPPFSILDRMLTMRVHLDDTSADNAPLLIVPGSHRLGRLVEREIGAVVEAGSTVACLAKAGDVWLYATPILHASEASRRPGRRRVLQIDFSADELSAGLDWAGIGPGSGSA
ncbi:MAG: phytanoyl-CoA dioxygenase family protein [Sphingomonas sp.]|nr:phytanoyl-CoA dioxygenase family protein [Sphingomonas sp.]